VGIEAEVQLIQYGKDLHRTAFFCYAGKVDNVAKQDCHQVKFLWKRKKKMQENTINDRIKKDLTLFCIELALIFFKYLMLFLLFVLFLPRFKKTSC
jgi:hypothetical protein